MRGTAQREGHEGGTAVDFEFPEHVRNVLVDGFHGAPEGRGNRGVRHALEQETRDTYFGPGESPAIEGSDHLPLPATASEDYAPLVAVGPVALLAFVLARLRGFDPDRPEWVARYHSQGLRHIVGVDTTTEG